MRRTLLAACLAAQAALCGGFTCSPADDAATCSALGDLYSQGLQPWAQASASGWAAAASGVPTPLCTFNGTTCDSAGRLLTLQLRNGLISGTLPASLGNASTLQLLDLGGNFLNGSIPAELGRLSALTALLLDGNFLLGPLPALPPSLTLLSVEDNELAGNGTATQPAAACTAACASNGAFTCPAMFGGSCAAACTAPAGCRPACPVPPPTAAAVAAAALAPHCAGVETSCFQCAAAMFNFFMRTSAPGLANMSAAQLGSCLLAQLPPFLAAGASPVALSAFRTCALPVRLGLPNFTCPARPTTAAWAAAKRSCASQTEVCNSCSAMLVDVLRAAGLAVPPLGLTFSPAHYELVANCLAQRALDIVAAGIDAVNLALGFAVCSGPSTAWYTWLANNSAALLYPAAAPAKPHNSSNAAALGGGLGGGLGGAALVAAALLLRRRRLAAADAAHAKNNTPPPATRLLRRDELTLHEPLGVGGYATVYRADWHGAPVAVKCFEEALMVFAAMPRMPSGSAESALFPSAATLGAREPDEASLLRELRVLSSLRHPNICAVYGAVSKPPMLVIELAPAGSLAMLLRRSTLKSLPWRARLHIAAGVACGAEFLNSQTPCIIHGDLKSHNVVLSAEMVPKLCDFGLARVLPALRDDSARDAMEGTARYMAPELALGHSITLPKAIDCYGLGVVLHDLAHIGLCSLPAAGDAAASAANSDTGRQALPNTVSVLFARSKQGFMVPVSPECPSPLATLLQRCLAVEPTERPEIGAVRLSLLEMEAQADSW